MGFQILFLILCLVNCAILKNIQQNHKFFRPDYTYLESTESFYKIHTLTKTWEKAKKTCESEGTILFHPKDEYEASEVIAFWNQTQPKTRAVFVGLNDLLIEGAYVTLDGLPLHDVYNNWDYGQPDKYGGVEVYVALRRDGTLNDVDPHLKLQFICKKNLANLQWNEECNLAMTDFVYKETLHNCYKYHTQAKNWSEAYTTCHAELSHLVIINSQAEADYIVQLWQNKKSENVAPSLQDQLYIGVHNRLGEGWKTVKGQDVKDSGYSKWEADQPSGDGACVTISPKGELNDLPCYYQLTFICEHEIPSASPNWENDKQDDSDINKIDIK